MVWKDGGGRGAGFHGRIDRIDRIDRVDRVDRVDRGGVGGSRRANRRGYAGLRGRVGMAPRRGHRRIVHFGIRGRRARHGLAFRCCLAGVPRSVSTRFEFRCPATGVILVQTTECFCIDGRVSGEILEEFDGVRLDGIAKRAVVGVSARHFNGSRLGMFRGPGGGGGCSGVEMVHDDE